MCLGSWHVPVNKFVAVLSILKPWYTCLRKYGTFTSWAFKQILEKGVLYVPSIHQVPDGIKDIMYYQMQNKIHCAFEDYAGPESTISPNFLIEKCIRNISSLLQACFKHSVPCKYAFSLGMHCVSILYNNDCLVTVLHTFNYCKSGNFRAQLFSRFADF